MLDAYEKVTSGVALGGATSMAPLIDKAMDIVKSTNKVSLSLMMTLLEF